MNKKAFSEKDILKWMLIILTIILVGVMVQAVLSKFG